MKKTVAEIKELARSCFGETSPGKVFTDEYLDQWFGLALEELYEECANHQVPGVEVIATYSLSSGLTSFDPFADAGLNFGDLISLEEREDGSSEDYRPVRIVESLPQRDQESYLYVAEWRGEVYHFIGATQDIELRVDFYSSGGALADDTLVALDGAQAFLAYRTAALAGPPKAYPELAEHWDKEARGKNPDGDPGGALHRFLKAPVRTLQQTPLQQAAYSAGGNRSTMGGRPPTFITD